MIHLFYHNAIDSMQISHTKRGEATPHHDLLVVLDRPLHQLGITLLALVVFASITPRFAIVAKDERQLIGVQNAVLPSDRPVRTSFTPRDANGMVAGLTKTFFLVQVETNSPLALIRLCTVLTETFCRPKSSRIDRQETQRDF